MSKFFGFHSPGDRDLQNILGSFFPNPDPTPPPPPPVKPPAKALPKTNGGGSKAGKPKSSATPQPKIDTDFEPPVTPLEKVADPEPPKKEKVVLSGPRWIAENPGFNEDTLVSVDVLLPSEHVNRTKVTFDLFAKTPQGLEWICSADAHAKDGKATCALPLYIPSYKDEKGNRLQKVDYFFTAKHSEADPLDGSIAPKQVDEMAKRLIETHVLSSVNFTTGKSFIRASEADVLKALGRSVKDWKDKYPDGKLAVFGHADAIGAETSNKALSERRAKSVHAYLANEPQVWEELYGEEKWGLACIQELLKHLGHDPGDLDGHDGPKTQGAVKAFQEKRRLPATGNIDVTSLQALFAAYFEAAESPCSTAKDFDAIDGKSFAGCSEFNLVENIQGARRVKMIPNKPLNMNPPCQQSAVPWSNGLSKSNATTVMTCVSKVSTFVGFSA
jgi:outer membrane protein OmpA-like peptidoglycan-associated protein